MMEKLGQAKTHLDLKKMIAEVDTNNSGKMNRVVWKHDMLSVIVYSNRRIYSNWSFCPPIEWPFQSE